MNDSIHAGESAFEAPGTPEVPLGDLGIQGFQNDPAKGASHEKPRPPPALRKLPCHF
jgi:hypothetical protein